MPDEKAAIRNDFLLSGKYPALSLLNEARTPTAAKADMLSVRWGDETRSSQEGSGTVYYVAPYDAKIVKKIDDPGRRHRWLFRALHLFDFPPLDRHELARQALVWGFSLLGALVTGLGCYVWGKRLIKGMTRVRKS